MVLNFSFFFFIGTKQVNQLSHSSLLNCSRWLCATHFRNILGHFCTPCISHHRDQELTLRFFKTNVIYIHDVSLQSNADSWSSTSTFLGFCSVLDRNGFPSGTAQLLESEMTNLLFHSSSFCECISQDLLDLLSFAYSSSYSLCSSHPISSDLTSSVNTAVPIFSYLNCLLSCISSHLLLS